MKLRNGIMKKQVKDIPTEPVLAFIASINGTGNKVCSFYLDEPNSIKHAMPADVPEKLALRKLRRLVKNGTIRGCYCGCRGDFEIA